MDDELIARARALQDEARAVLAELDLDRLLGPVLPTGSFVSGLMVWRDLDVMVLGRPDLTPGEVLRLVAPLADRPGFTGLALSDERGPRSPTGEERDERFHVPITWRHGGHEWRIDLTIWLHDPHRGVTEWHERLRDTLPEELRTAILRIKDVWHRRPEYPDEVGGADVYRAVLDDGVRTPEEFARWWAARSDTPPAVPPPG